MIPQHLLDALSLPPDSTEKDLKRRYAQLIKIHRPDADPEGFARVREAYEAVQTWLRHAQAMVDAPAPGPRPEPADELAAERATTVHPGSPTETRAPVRPLELDDPLVPPADLRDARALLQMFAGAATGDWALRLLLLTLCATPLRQLSGWSWPLRLRRMLGLYAFFYATLHFSAYLFLDLGAFWAQILTDIAKRPYITVGFTAWLLLIPLAITSTNGALPAVILAGWLCAGLLAGAYRVIRSRTVSVKALALAG